MTSTSTGEAIELYCLKPSDAYWADLLQAMTHDFYHLPAYVALEAKRLDATAEGLLIRQGDCYFFLPYLIRSCASMLPEYISDAAPRDIISPYGYGSALLSGAAMQNQAFLLSAMEQAMAFWRERRFCTAYLRLHPLLHPELADLDGAELTGLARREVGRSVAIDLSLDDAALQAQLSQRSQDKAQQARQNGCRVRWTDATPELPTFIALYRTTMRRLNLSAEQTFDPEYFYGLAEALGEQLHLCLIEREGLAIAASLVTETCGIVQCHLSGAKAEMMDDAPSALMMLEILDWAKARDNLWLHLGTGLEGSASGALYRFNCQFSALSLPVYSLRLILDEQQYDQLIHERSKRIHLDPLEIRQADMFPAYRITGAAA